MNIDTANPELNSGETIELVTPMPGIRLDKYLVQTLPQFSRSYIKKLINQNYILVNGRSTKASQKLSEADRITVTLPTSSTHPPPEPIPLTIIYEDKEIIVIDKPAGLTTHPAPGHPDHTLVNAVLSHCPGIARSSNSMRPGIVHRLDKDTSGLIVIAKNDFSRRYLAEQFKNRTVKKEYLVLVQGKVSPKQGIIDAPIGRDTYHRKRMTIVEKGKEAKTEYKVREYLGNYTLLEVIPLTGRTHQIRVHLSAIGYPVVGDPVYGVKATFLNRQFIHAYRLGFCLLSTNQYREFTSPLPPDLEQALQSLAGILNQVQD
ncbi:MAG: RluA family pseudouridine synthase [Chloroflexi bacterium CG_4_9_14_3_um_filter_45_9]|nr:MAG: hypothetical protein AUK00_03645 [Dehalococcoidia bacterium CG2_30_46_9]PIU23980.1 MAG: RluA family pseudouridine synthase [Chloroflexi bacterium CG08_land_8_20_14_0_20_45_12]PIX27816.1 MAG: RluA family pseudouridine synthase [Chloroflexi bacterium CG_4_8_14_3_um_filter_45_15]PJB50026.1 MAG: RluA family pseudouridine synthase [Chloroflexi bacterium CG_4_9_14_3_um_filter_45_9]